MRALGKWALAVTVSAALAADGVVGTTWAFAAGDHAACDQHLTAGASGCSAQAKSVSNEDRVANWLVERILDFDLTGDPVVDYSAADITAATGVDATNLDLDRIRERVLTRLRDASRWGEVRLRVEEVGGSRAADDDRSPVEPAKPQAASGAREAPSASARAPGAAFKMAR